MYASTGSTFGARTGYGYRNKMALWLGFALMTAAAIFAVLWPLSRSGKVRSGSDAEVYRDQLDEIARDSAAGLIGPAEAEAARVEVSRRLIAAKDAEQAAVPVNPTRSLWRRRALAIVALVFVPLMAGTVYLLHGSPQLPAEPLAARMEQARKTGSVAAMVARVETHLDRNPNDVRGWEVLAPIYISLGRYDDAVHARRNALRYGGETAGRQASLGEAMVAAENGIVTVEAKKAFERALALDPNDAKSQFYIGLAAKQDGDGDRAAKLWQAMLDKAPAGAAWVPAVRQALANLRGRSPAAQVDRQPSVAPIAGNAAPSGQEMAAASQMTPEQRGEMIRGMVARLADRLKTDGADVDGWMRLVRAYVVLGERDKATAAAADARRALGSDPDKVRRIDDLAKGLGLSG
jgi:cytochrome c-type biogenesis protein CcmH